MRSYSASRAFREATALASTDVFHDYAITLEEYVRSGADEAALRRRAAQVSIEIKLRAMLPERLFHALRIGASTIGHAETTHSEGGEFERRYRRAIQLFLVAYFNL